MRPPSKAVATAPSAAPNAQLTAAISSRLGVSRTLSPPLFRRKERCYKRHMPDFRILGPLEVSDETGAFLLGGLKQRAVLALLLLEPGRTVSVDRLIDALWGENPPRTATTSLQNFISQLRKTLGADVTFTTPGAVFVMRSWVIRGTRA